MFKLTNDQIKKDATRKKVLYTICNKYVSVTTNVSYLFFWGYSIDLPSKIQLPIRRIPLLFIKKITNIYDLF